MTLFAELIAAIMISAKTRIVLSFIRELDSLLVSDLAQIVVSYAFDFSSEGRWPRVPSLWNTAAAILQALVVSKRESWFGHLDLWDYSIYACESSEFQALANCALSRLPRSSGMSVQLSASGSIHLPIDEYGERCCVKKRCGRLRTPLLYIDARWIGLTVGVLCKRNEYVYLCTLCYLYLALLVDENGLPRD